MDLHLCYLFLDQVCALSSNFSRSLRSEDYWYLQNLDLFHQEFIWVFASVPFSYFARLVFALKIWSGRVLKKLSLMEPLIDLPLGSIVLMLLVNFQLPCFNLAQSVIEKVDSSCCQNLFYWKLFHVAFFSILNLFLQQMVIF